VRRPGAGEDGLRQPGDARLVCIGLLGSVIYACATPAQAYGVVKLFFIFFMYNPVRTQTTKHQTHHTRPHPLYHASTSARLEPLSSLHAQQPARLLPFQVKSPASCAIATP
jgi:hypothetical protein